MEDVLPTELELHPNMPSFGGANTGLLLGRSEPVPESVPLPLFMEEDEEEGDALQADEETEVLRANGLLLLLFRPRLSWLPLLPLTALLLPAKIHYDYY